MDELIAQAAEQLGYPPALVERSARARAQAQGTSVEAILTTWVGGEAPAAAPPSAPAAEPAAAPAAPSAPASAAPATAEPTGPDVEVLPAAEDAPDAPPPPEPEAEPAEEKVGSGIPRWLAAAFLIIPTVAVMYALFLPNGPPCGRGAVLAVDPATGEAVGCNGRPYGETEVDFFALGQQTYAQCAACHGAGGQGGGSFPAFTGGAVLATFPAGQCLEHVEWVTLGTAGWPEPTYGAPAKPVGGSGAVMPGFGQALTAEEIAAVSLYERVAFGGEPLAEALTDCGLAGEVPDGEGAAAAPGE